MLQRQRQRRPGNRALSLSGILLAVGLGCRSDPPVTIRAGSVFDGSGDLIRNAVVTVSGGRIRSVVPSRGEPVTHDFPAATLLPGLIDAHVHISGYITPRGRVHVAGDQETPEAETAGKAANALATLRAGFTTVASMSSELELRDAINRGDLPGPRILTSLGGLSDTTLSPEELRKWMRRIHARGADFVKVFNSGDISRGGRPMFSAEQLGTICLEARRAGVRSVIHAHSDTSIALALAAGCDQIEHGVLASRRALEAIARAGVDFDPQCRLVPDNYLAIRPALEGMRGWDSAAFAYVAEARALLVGATRLAVSVPGLPLVFGSDATAGAHGRNADDLVCRVREGGQSPRDALVTATSRNAAALGLGTEVGRIAPGYAADLIVVDGDPLQEIEAIRRVLFVMKGGQVFVKP